MAFNQQTPSLECQIIEPRKGWAPVSISEIWARRELLYFLVKRDIKVRYKQTILGGLWAIIQPVFTMIVFTLFFGKLAKVPSDGIPYPIFVYAGLLPWIYFSNALTASGNSLVANSGLITKIYFPRIIIPASACIGGLVDLLIAALVLVGMMAWYHYVPGIALALLPVLVGLTACCAFGIGLWLSALNVQYRDIRYAIPFLVQLWLFVTPVIYPVSMISEKYQWLLAINPMGGIISAFRACLLGKPIEWELLGISSIVVMMILATGLYYFRTSEENFADII